MVTHLLLAEKSTFDAPGDKRCEPILSDPTGTITGVIHEDDLAFEAARARVRAGEYLDSMPGLPGEDTEGGGVFQYAPDGRLQRVYSRWHVGFREARDLGCIPDLPPLHPASPDAVEACETAIGRSLPPLLRRCYLELGNGGFGPSYGLMSIEELAHAVPDRDSWPMSLAPACTFLLPVSSWGCGIESCIDLCSQDAQMWVIDPNYGPDNEADPVQFPHGTASLVLYPHGMTFASWLHRWARQDLSLPLVVEDEETGAWRHATDTD
ncbi:SMI1/KNR4 family protein [Actinoplanes oblitus]|uniref:SMI1/KNR4 family protein n=1 Tax=Actinoplanes oblitus TaxID=3040509 RepID=A0ABY8WQ50_9ACTN|nr:SMI1/KNR4 family protein [Actinoplanes oblitus]WIN00025.1 SMI1/KNR4 family protein [Actinoplanes oblitus]